MGYPRVPNYKELTDQLNAYAELQYEYGAEGIAPVIAEVERAMKKGMVALKRLPIDKALAKREPNTLRGIRALRPSGPRRLWDSFDKTAYRERLQGAMLARFAGCILGSAVEFWPIARMERLAKENNDAFPPVDYWKRVDDPYFYRYKTIRREHYTRGGMRGVPMDDDIVYTLLGLLTAEEAGLDFTVEDVGAAWVRYLPFACTAEDAALRNLKAGVPAQKAAQKNNPYCGWIGADIRSDPWGYMAPGYPEEAARMAYTDAMISHRRNGVYGEMYFAAAIAAAFALDDPMEALEVGLSEIPRQCAMAKGVRWALQQAPKIRNYRQAREAVDAKFKGMSCVHTINNACLTIWGLAIGGTDVTKVLGETVAMGMDNDCTAATAGSIVGAVVGKKGVPAHWYKPFGNTVHSYLNEHPTFKLSDLAKRFTRLAEAVHARA